MPALPIAVVLRYSNYWTEDYDDFKGLGRKMELFEDKGNKEFAIESGMNIISEACYAVNYNLMDADNSSFVSLANDTAYNVKGETLDYFGTQ